jgi:hypothetical protein
MPQLSLVQGVPLRFGPRKVADCRCVDARARVSHRSCRSLETAFISALVEVSQWATGCPLCVWI